MKALLLKDILTQRRVVILAGGYSLFFFLMFALVGDSPSVGFIYPLAAVAIGYMILLGSFKADKNETPTYMMSLPVSRADWVNEKFLLLIGATAYGVVTTAVFGAIALLPFFGGADRWLIPLDLLRIFIGLGLFSGILPFYFAFGQRAIRYAIITLMVLGVVVQIGLLITMSLGNQEAGRLIDLVVGWFTSFSVMRRNLALALIASIILAVSYTFSVWYFGRKDI